MTTTADKRPIYGYLSGIEDDGLRLKAVSLVQFQGIGTVDDLAKYTSAQLGKLGVPSEIIRGLEERLQTNYGLSFAAESSSPTAPSRTYGKRPSPRPQHHLRPRASGAPPPSDVKYPGPSLVNLL